MRRIVELGTVHVPDGVVGDVETVDVSMVDVAMVAVGTVDVRCRRVRLRAERDLAALATGRFARPSASIELSIGRLAPDTAFLGFAFTQFALPVVAGPAMDFDFHPAANLRSPSAVGVLAVRSAGEHALIGPLVNAHEQIIAVRDGIATWGWHGDLDEVPAGFETVVGVYEGPSLSELFRRWSDDLGARRVRRYRAANPLTSHLSYWTDNGAAYWYRTEPATTIADSVAATVRALHAAAVPVRAIELDSWCYDHEVARPITEIGYPEEVPPTGMLTWTPRADAFANGTDPTGAVADGEIADGEIADGAVSSSAVSIGAVSDGAVSSSAVSTGAVADSAVADSAVSKSAVSTGADSTGAVANDAAVVSERDSASAAAGAGGAPAGVERHEGDAIERWAASIGRPPLVIHSRHISPRSPYTTEGEWWLDEIAAAPVDNDFFRRWFDDARRWGVCCIEQDWMLLYWFGVRQLRATAGRALAWQRALDRHASATGVDLMWCMATPADFVAAATLDRVIAVRTCDDYRFAADPALLWTWYLTVNRLAAACGLPAFKDCFFSSPEVTQCSDPIDGDVHAELEAVLSALSAGPVGIGDRIGRTNRDIVMRTCDDDGRLRPVDHPVSLIDGCLFGEPARGERAAWATTTATRDGRVWTYVLAINTANDHRTIADRLSLTELGVNGARMMLDWRAGREAPSDEIEVILPAREWALFVLAPSSNDTVGIDTVGIDTVGGDWSKYVVAPSSL